MSSKLFLGVKKNLFALITIILSVSILLYFLFTTDGITALFRIYKTIRLHWLIMAIIAAFGSMALEGYVLHLLCKREYPEWTYGYSLVVAMTGLLYSALTPFSTGGQPMQIYSMKKAGMDTGVAGSIIALKTLVYQIVMVLFSLILVILKLGFFQTTISNFSFLTIIGLASNGAFILLIFLFAISEKTTDKVLLFFIRLFAKLKLCKHPDKRYQKIHDELELFHGSTKMVKGAFKTYLIGAGFTVIQIILSCLIPYFIYRSFNFHEQDVLTMMAAQAFVTMVSAFVPLPGASGGAEGSFYLFFGMFFHSGTIVPAILLWRIITYYFNILFGAVAVWVGRKLPEKQLTAKKYS